MANPVMMTYRTSDGRFVALQMLSPQKYWPDLCKVLGHPEMATDPRFATFEARRQNNRVCIQWLEGIFAERTYDEWRRVLADFEGEWVPIVDPHELPDDPQVKANGYLTSVDAGTGVTVPLVPSPVQFDGQPCQPARAPEHGEHTETVLLDLGLSWDDLDALKQSGVIL